MSSPPAYLHSSAVKHDGSQPRRNLCLSSELVQVRIGSDKSILNRVLCVSCVAKEVVCPSVQRLQAISQDLFQLLSPFFPWNFIAFVTPGVCICVLHRVFLNPCENPRDLSIESFLYES